MADFLNVVREGSKFDENFEKKFSIKVMSLFKLIFDPIKDKKWGQIAAELGYTNKAGAASALRLNYEKHLYPFDVVRTFSLSKIFDKNA